MITLVTRPTLALLLLFSLLPPSAAEGRSLIDGKGTLINLPEKVTRVAANGAINQMVLMLGGGKKLVATSVHVKSNPYFAKIYPSVSQLPTPFGTNRGTVNLETLVSAGPQVVFGRFEALHNTGIVPIAVDLSGPEQIKQSILLVGQVLGASEAERAKAFVTYYDSVVRKIKTRTAELPPEERPRVYLASGIDGLRTEGGRSIVNFWIETAGGENIAAAALSHSASMTLEAIVAAEPDIIIATSPALRDAIVASPQWSAVKAVKNARVYVNPKGAYLWSVRSAEGVLQYPWAAKLIHPERFGDIDMEREVVSFYQRFYGYALSREETGNILSPSSAVAADTAQPPIRITTILLFMASALSLMFFARHRTGKAVR